MRDQIIRILKSRIQTAQIADDIAPHVVNAEAVADLICALSPSPAVAWRFWDGGSWQLVDYKPDLAAWRKVEPLYATPPVRGAREAIARIIEDNIYHKHDGNWDGDREDLLVAADAILSLSVQPSIDKTKLYTRLSNQHIPQDMIDSIWQEIQEAIL